MSFAVCLKCLKSQLIESSYIHKNIVYIYIYIYIYKCSYMCVCVCVCACVCQCVCVCVCVCVYDMKPIHTIRGLQRASLLRDCYISSDHFPSKYNLKTVFKHECWPIYSPLSMEIEGLYTNVNKHVLKHSMLTQCRRCMHKHVSAHECIHSKARCSDVQTVSTCR